MRTPRSRPRPHHLLACCAVLSLGAASAGADDAPVPATGPRLVSTATLVGCTTSGSISDLGQITNQRCDYDLDGDGAVDLVQLSTALDGEPVRCTEHVPYRDALSPWSRPCAAVPVFRLSLHR